MKRAAFDDTKDAGETIVGNTPNLRPCRTCHEATKWELLSLFGGLCGRCYDAYCKGAGSGPLGKREAGRKYLAEMNARVDRHGVRGAHEPE